MEATHQPHAVQRVSPPLVRAALLTGGGDRPYALGLASALAAHGTFVDFVGSDHLVSDELARDPHVNFLNLRGNQDSRVDFKEKVRRIVRYYFRLLGFAASAKAPIFHILWNNKCETFDRVFLLLLYKLFKKRIVFTAHNVNAAKRDNTDNWFNRVTLRIQYHLVDHIFVHTQKSRHEIQTGFGVCAEKVSVIPFGINNTVNQTALSADGARRRLGITHAELTMLFFGQIAPYKGLQYLVAAFTELAKERSEYRLIIAGSPKWDGAYWQRMKRIIRQSGLEERIIQRIEFIPDGETEVFFKAADVVVLPYTDIFQSGVLSLAYSFGLPVVASDVGSLKEEIIEGETGFVCGPQNAKKLAEAIRTYFRSDLFYSLDTRRRHIQDYANDRYSWDKVAAITTGIYQDLLKESNSSRPLCSRE